MQDLHYQELSYNTKGQQLPASVASKVSTVTTAPQRRQLEVEQRNLEQLEEQLQLKNWFSKGKARQPANWNTPLVRSRD